ncbi:hypothetical protein PRIPAC_93888 [Pristionchus pacificus]|uniref:Uncharacterized protein n=1 Tax=Pristionchus pacificus TaxID=54126 RepID=A0A8R1YUM7_PRIPA|nr:hypothetical protein PRIPAC_93888 [Pristionchus pacificus]|eukprot:PDM68109.1 hypothetical protein PRIPAC_46153 [Pristionchus pacificus]
MLKSVLQLLHGRLGGVQDAAGPDTLHTPSWEWLFFKCVLRLFGDRSSPVHPQCRHSTEDEPFKSRKNSQTGWLFFRPALRIHGDWPPGA